MPARPGAATPALLAVLACTRPTPPAPEQRPADPSSHLWLWALCGRLDAYFWLYAGLNAAYLARGWLGLTLRFGRP